jgi:homoserine dehydrogenase
VNRTLVRLLANRTAELHERYGISFHVTGIASRRLGWVAESHGLNVDEILAKTTNSAVGNAEKKRLPVPGAKTVHEEVTNWLAAAKADVLFEGTSLNVETGQPAVDYIRAALEYDAHVITANKGPIVHAYRELRDLAASKRKCFLFESTVMDGVPIFSLFDQLPAVHLQGFHGILNSTTNVILSLMEQGLTFQESQKKAQELGIAETDATHDIDGWDAAVKTAALITVLMDTPIRLDQIHREGIRDLTPQAVRTARRDGWAFKLVCRARRTPNGVEASVAPEKVVSTQPMAKIAGTSSYVYFETDIFPGLALTEENPGLYATAYGMLADLVRAASE